MMDIQLYTTKPGENDFSNFLTFPEKLYGTEHKKYIHSFVETNLHACLYVVQNSEVAGRVAIYANPNLKWQGETCLCFGAYECLDDPEVSNCLLDRIEKTAEELQTKWIIGPLSGSTWNTYRFSLQNNKPHFFLEPYHPDYYNTQVKAAGYSAIAEYFSTLDEEMHIDTEQMKTFAARFASLGAVIRPFNVTDPKGELLRIGQFCIESFQNNLLYTPISPDTFADAYAPYVNLFEPTFILLAENNNKELQALFFAMPDHTDSSKKTIIIKSIARKKGSSFRGISTYLCYLVYQKAKSMGYTRAIHAFMHKENISGALSARFSLDRFKQYVLYGKRVA
ncbi:MAG: hypothetical protein R2794_00045 [Chitinophagales bacterium]